MTLPATVPQKSVEVGSLGFAPTNATELMQMAKFIAASKLKPQGLDDAADVFLVMAVGMSWGFDPMMALQTLHVVKGRVGLPGETCAALIQSHPLCELYRTWFTGDGKTRAAHVQTARKGRDSANEPVTFTWADAERAQLTNGDNWKKYPDDMLLWKAVARDKRRNWPDVYPGLRVKEDYEGHEPPTRVEASVRRAPQRDPLLASVVDAEIAAPSAPAEVPSGTSEDSETPGGAASNLGDEDDCPACYRSAGDRRENGHEAGCPWTVPT